jgi:ABC-type sugar transport system permease subunit
VTAPLGGGEAIGRVEMPTPEPSRRRRSSWVVAVLPALVLGAVLIGVWYLISYVVLAPRRRFLLRPPHEVVETGFLDQDNLAEMLDGLYWSTRVALIGLTISIVLGVAIAILMSQTIIIERATFPFLVMLQAIPILAIVPLISFWFGTGENARVIVCVIISLFPIIDPHAQTDVARRPAGDVRRAEDRRRAVRDRGDRRGLLLRSGQARARPVAEAFRQPARG